jgi:Tetracyclin repressor-like, C-terminal domain
VAMRLLENLLGILLAGGLDAQDAAWAADILAAQVTYAAIEAELRRTDPSALAAEITANFARLPADDFPLITAHAAQLVAGDVGERFRFAIDVVIDGVLGRASPR